MKKFSFQTQEEYSSFLVWAIEGSTIGQRMQMGQSQDKIPAYWEYFKPIADKLPPTLEEFYADSPIDGTPTDTDPAN